MGACIDPPGYDAGKKIKGRKWRVPPIHRQVRRCVAVREMRKGPSRPAVRFEFNRCKLRTSRAAVVSVAEKPGLDFGRYDLERRARAHRR
jgi:hypothetical protein